MVPGQGRVRPQDLSLLFKMRQVTASRWVRVAYNKDV